MKKITITIISALFAITSSMAQHKNYDSKGKVKILGDKTTLMISENTSGENKIFEMLAIPAIVAAVVPTVIDLVATNVKQQMKRNTLAYSGEYKGFVSGENFYLKDDSINLPKLTLTRKIIKKNGGEETAVQLVLIPEISADKTAFRYYVDKNITYNYSISKTRCKYDYIHLNLELEIKSLHVSKSEYKLSDVRTTNISIPLIHVGSKNDLNEKIYSGWIPFPARSTVAKAGMDSVSEEKIVIKTDKDDKVEETKEEIFTKKSNPEKFEKIASNTGLYEISITATETNPYKVKAVINNEVAEGSSESVSKILKTVFEQITKEEEKDK